MKEKKPLAAGERKERIKIRKRNLPKKKGRKRAIDWMGSFASGDVNKSKARSPNEGNK